MKQKKIKQSALFSAILPLCSETEVEWWQRVAAGGSWSPIGVPLDTIAQAIGTATHNVRLDFNVKVLEDGVWFYSKGKSTPLHLARLVQIFFKTFPSNEPRDFAITWAEICNQPRLDAFGGGAFVVTAQKISSWTAWDWVGRLVKEEEEISENKCTTGSATETGTSSSTAVKPLRSSSKAR